MELRAVYPDDIPRECREYADTLAQSVDNREHRVRVALAVAELFEMLEARSGPIKWVRLNHFQTLALFAFDQREHPRQLPQIVVHVGPNHPAGLTIVEYRLPAEHRPWIMASASATTTVETADLVLDAVERCESRREYLILD